MKKVASIIFMGFAILFATEINAQPPNPGGGQGDPPGIPIDGGISILLAAGAAYGGKKIYDMSGDKGKKID